MYEVYSTKAGDSSSSAWRWALTLRGSSLTRYQASRLAQEIRAEKSKAVVYSNGELRYSDVGQTIRAS